LDGKTAVTVVCSGAWNGQSAGVSGSKTESLVSEVIAKYIWLNFFVDTVCQIDDGFYGDANYTSQQPTVWKVYSHG